jgi:hypothetical protein
MTVKEIFEGVPNMDAPPFAILEIVGATKKARSEILTLLSEGYLVLGWDGRLRRTSS